MDEREGSAKLRTVTEQSGILFSLLFVCVVVVSCFFMDVFCLDACMHVNVVHISNALHRQVPFST